MLTITFFMTNRETHGHGNSMTDSAQRAEPVKRWPYPIEIKFSFKKFMTKKIKSIYVLYICLQSTLGLFITKSRRRKKTINTA